jgi:hypothetical protein
MTKSETIDMLKRCVEKSGLFVNDWPKNNQRTPKFIDAGLFLAALEEERVREHMQKKCDGMIGNCPKLHTYCNGCFSSCPECK